jgi:two-component system, NtrC family, sensor kinase
MLLNWIHVAVIHVNGEDMVEQANDAALNMLGWTREEFMGCNCHSTIHHTLDDGTDYPWEFSPVFAALEDGSSHHVDGDVFWRRDGSSFSADYIVCPIRSDEGDVTGAVLTFRNLTEQRMIEAKRIHNMKLLSIGELAAGIAHEINTPVQFIANNLHFLQESFADLTRLISTYRDLLSQLSDKQEELGCSFDALGAMEEEVDLEYLEEEVPRALEQTLEGVDSVTRLVLGLKGFSHSGNDIRTGTDVNQIIANTLIVCRNEYKYIADIETVLEKLPIIDAYPGDIGQVILNLIINAAHAIADVKGNDDSKGKVTIQSRKDGDWIEVSVTDTGAGIPESIRERIFDPFFTTKEVGRGSGQGLAIARSIIVDKHEGEFFFTSELGRGSTFTLKIPSATPKSPS